MAIQIKAAVKQFVELQNCQISLIIDALRCAAVCYQQDADENDIGGMRITYETQSRDAFKLANKLEDLQHE